MVWIVEIVKVVGICDVYLSLVLFFRMAKQRIRPIPHSLCPMLIRPFLIGPAHKGKRKGAGPALTPKYVDTFIKLI